MWSWMQKRQKRLRGLFADRTIVVEKWKKRRLSEVGDHFWQVTSRSCWRLGSVIALELCQVWKLSLMVQKENFQGLSCWVKSAHWIIFFRNYFLHSVIAWLDWRHWRIFFLNMRCNGRKRTSSVIEVISDGG